MRLEIALPMGGNFDFYFAKSALVTKFASLPPLKEDGKHVILRFTIGKTQSKQGLRKEKRPLQENGKLANLKNLIAIAE